LVPDLPSTDEQPAARAVTKARAVSGNVLVSMDFSNGFYITNSVIRVVAEV